MPSVFGALLSTLLVCGVILADVQPTELGDETIHPKVTQTCHTPNEYGTCPPPSNLEECGIWLAPSSIPGAGLGMYAGRDFKKGENLQPSGEIVIPQVDLNSHQFALGDNFYILWDDYTWSGSALHMDNLGYVLVKVSSPGFGSAANSFLDLINVDELRPKHSIPNSLHRSRDPGAGAFSTYHDRQSVAMVDIQKGEELFVDYGDAWYVQNCD